MNDDTQLFKAVHGQRGLQALDDRRGVRAGLRENGGRVRGAAVAGYHASTIRTHMTGRPGVVTRRG